MAVRDLLTHLLILSRNDSDAASDYQTHNTRFEYVAPIQPCINKWKQ